MSGKISIYAVDKLIEQARQLASNYKQTTGKPLPGVSNEIAEYDAAQHLKLTPCQDRTKGFDAVRNVGVNGPKRVQIKARAIFTDNFRGQRVGQLKLDKQWDSVILVLMDEHYEALEMLELTREDLLEHLDTESNRSKRGAMSVAKFKIIANLVWTREEGRLLSAWDNYQTEQ